MVDIATLGLRIDSTGALKAASDLDTLTGKAITAEQGTKGLEGAAKTTSAALTGAGAAAARTATAYNASGAAARTMGAQHRLAAGSVGNLTSQFNDIGVMLAAGQSPLQLAIQQGTQISQVFGNQSAGAAIRGLGAAFMSMLSPLNLITIGTIAGGAALVQWGMRAAGAGEEAEEAGENLDAFADALDRYQGYAETALSSTADLQQRFGDFAKDVRENARYLAQVTASQSVGAFTGQNVVQGIDEAKAAAEELRQARVAYGSQVQGLPEGQQRMEWALVKDQIEALRERAEGLAETIGLSVEEVEHFGGALTNVGQQDDFEGIRDAADQAIDRIREYYGEGNKIPPVMAQILQSLNEVANSSGTAVVSMQELDGASVDVRGGIALAADEAERLANGLGMANNIAGSMRGLQYGGRGGDPRDFMGGSSGDFRAEGARYQSMMDAAEKGIMELISHVESKGDYNTTLHSGAYRPEGHDSRARPITTMTINEVLAMQRQMLANPNNDENSSAAGRYQIVSKTLQGLVDQLKLTGNETYDPAMQDRLAEQLLRGRRGQGVEGLRNEWEGLRGVPDSLIQQALGNESIAPVDSGVASATAEAQREAAKAAKDLARANESSQKAYDGLVASMDEAVAASQQFERAQETVKEALDRGQISTAEAAQAIAAARQEYQHTMADIAEEAAKLEDNAQRGADAMTNLFMSITDGAGSARDALSQLIMQMATGFMQRGMNSLAASGIGGGFFAGLGDLLSFDGGGYTGGGSRSGGVDGKGGFLGVLHPQETVIDHTKGQGTGGGMNFSPTYQIDARGSDMSEAQFRRILAENNQQMKSDIKRSMRTQPKSAWGL